MQDNSKRITDKITDAEAVMSRVRIEDNVLHLMFDVMIVARSVTIKRCVSETTTNIDSKTIEITTNADSINPVFLTPKTHIMRVTNIKEHRDHNTKTLTCKDTSISRVWIGTPQKGERRGNARSSQTNNTHDTRGDYSQINAKKQKFCSLSDNTIQIEILGREVTCLVDTGATISCCSINLLHSLGITRDQFKDPQSKIPWVLVVKCIQ